MWITSKFNVLYLLVALMSIEQSVSASKLAETTQDLCKNKDRDDFELKLRATMLFRNTLILIDEGWLVYKIAHSNINNSYSQLMIDVLGKPLEEEWPAFKDDTETNWTSIKPNVVTIYHVDIKTPFLYMVATGMKGVCYNLNTSKFCPGRPDDKDGLVRPSITDNGPTQFLISMNMKDEYCFFSNENQTINKAPFKPKCLWLGYANLTWWDDGSQKDQDFFSMGYMYYTWNRTNQTVKNITVIDERFDPHTEISPDFELENLDWHLPPGFVYEGDFHFFDRKNVYSFPISPLKMINYPDEPKIHATHPLKITKVKDYFHCVQLNISGKTFPPGGYTLDPGAASNRIALWIWIVVGVIVLLLIVAIIVLLVWYFSLGSKSHQSKGKPSSEALLKHDRTTTATVKQSLQVKDNKK